MLAEGDMAVFEVGNSRGIKYRKDTQINRSASAECTSLDTKAAFWAKNGFLPASPNF